MLTLQAGHPAGVRMLVCRGTRWMARLHTGLLPVATHAATGYTHPALGPSQLLTPPPPMQGIQSSQRTVATTNTCHAVLIRWLHSPQA